MINALMQKAAGWVGSYLRGHCLAAEQVLGILVSWIADAKKLQPEESKVKLLRFLKSGQMVRIFDSTDWT
jgi:hypothetical protein